MNQILKIGEHSEHDETFLADRPNGYPHYLLLLVKTPAQFYIEDAWVQTPPNVILVFQPGQRHLYKAFGNRYSDHWAHIVCSTPPFGEHFPYGKPIILHQPKLYDELFHIIYGEFFHASTHTAMILHNLITAFLQKLSDESRTTDYPALYYDLVKLREQIYQQPENDWSAGLMAEQLHISIGYLHNNYQHFFHTTCMQDVITSRIQNACELLVSTDQSLETIGELCGYHHTEHFIRQFKLQIGQTPGKYRRTMYQNRDT